jgi:type III restriction enzyme
MEELYSRIKSAMEFGTPVPEVPSYLRDNLKHPFYKWQEEALQYFLVNEQRNGDVNSPTHLMFNMATGTGKTLIMAAMILYYYNKGYRHFIFFVNQNNIIDKTENNFLNSSHTKYLFRENIIIEDQRVSIKKVDTFSDNPQNIEIKFTSIQQLYNDIHIQKENQTTLDDLNSKNIVMLADEAHHLNTETKNKKEGQEDLIKTELTGNTGKEEVERKGWEHTVIQLILNKNSNGVENKNVLLEFTATIPDTQSIAEKYQDKIIFKFGLKEFLQAGYTKEINLVSSTLDKKGRILQALLFQWYRHKIAIKYNIPNFKPVILFRSKTIDESKKDFKNFLNWIDDLSVSDFDFLKKISDTILMSSNPYEQGYSRTKQVISFIDEEDVKISEVINWIKQSYKERNCIITNSKDKSARGRRGEEKTTEDQEKLLNSLEDINNHIRAIFTVDRLTEGWDVLNLYDIVRLYQGQNTGGSTKKTPEATIKEKQLIGRGVRYYPFSYNDRIDNKRKFDEDLEHELRVLEELYYYTYDEESRYISHLKNELKKDGYIRDDKIIETFEIKKDFAESDFYKNTKIWYNKQIENPERRRKNLDDIKRDFFMPYKIKGLELSEEQVDFENEVDIEMLKLEQKGSHTITKRFHDIEKHIVLKAINIKAQEENSLFKFKNLSQELEIESIDELQSEKLANFEIKIITDKNISYDDIDNSQKLNIIIKFLESVFAELRETIAPKIGSDFIPGDLSEFFGESKTKTIEISPESERLSAELKEESWYVIEPFYGTSEEMELVEFIKNSLGNLEEGYRDIYLLRNEEVYKIYDFDKGRGFQPDFILFLKTKEKKDVNAGFKTELYYQVFIEPKGNEYIDEKGTFENGKEGWKEAFLNEISERYGLDNIITAENPHYRLIGLPFFNKDHSSKFTEQFATLFS